MEDWGLTRGVSFNFGSPHHPAGQGAIERLIAEVKKELKFITKRRTFTFGQLDAALAECSYLVNSRPLQLHPGPAGEEGYICPNDLLMGRSDQAPVIGQFESGTLSNRVQFMRSVVLQFWDRWYTSYFQRLVKYHRWRCKTRNAREGDVVLILDREAPKGKFTLGEVSTVKKDPDGVVRRVMVRYKLSNSGDKFLERNVRSLALILAAEERTDLKSEDKCIDNPIESDDVKVIINKKNKEENTTFNSKIVSQVEDNSDDDNTEDISEEELPREVKNLAVDVASDHQPAVHNGVQLESSSCGRKRWQTVKFGF